MLSTTAMVEYMDVVLLEFMSIMGRKFTDALAGWSNVIHVLDDARIGGNMRVNSLRAESVAWLNAFQKGWVGVGVN